MIAGDCAYYNIALLYCVTNDLHVSNMIAVHFDFFNHSDSLAELAIFQVLMYIESIIKFEGGCHR